MELQEAIEGRRSIRAYDASQKVSKEDLLTLITAALIVTSYEDENRTLKA